MNLIVQKTPGFFIFTLLLIFFALLLNGCSNSNEKIEATPIAKTEKTIAENFSLPDTINITAANKLIDNFQDEPLKDIDSDFFFGAKMINAEKVISLQLDGNQRNIFFKELKSVTQDTTNKVELRVYMALRSASQAEAVSQKPKIAPVLELIVNEKHSNSFFPLRPFNFPFLMRSTPDKSNKISVSDCFKKVMENTSKGKNGLRKITKDCAQYLVSNWDTVSTANIAPQLYVNKKSNNPAERIQYYTFGIKDTRGINISDQKYFYLHFGQLDQPDHVPLRAIIHLSETPIDASQRVGAAPEYFEFAMPCPPYCRRPL